MSYKLFSKRQKLERGEVPDVLIYQQLPKPLRVQIKMIVDEVSSTKPRSQWRGSRHCNTKSQ